MVKLDERSFKQFFFDQIKLKNPFYYAFFRKSLIEPRFIRVVIFYLNIISALVIQCLFYSDELVESMNKFQIDKADSVKIYLL